MPYDNFYVCKNCKLATVIGAWQARKGRPDCKVCPQCSYMQRTVQVRCRKRYGVVVERRQLPPVVLRDFEHVGEALEFRERQKDRNLYPGQEYVLQVFPIGAYDTDDSNVNQPRGPED